MDPRSRSTSTAAQWPEPGNPREPVAPAQSIQATAADPTGDTFNPGWDLTSISGETDDTTLTLTLTFAGTITPPPSGPGPEGQPPGGGNEVIGFIDLDVDQNAATGGTPNVGVFCPQPPTTRSIWATTIPRPARSLSNRCRADPSRPDHPQLPFRSLVRATA